jgi:hypothetical protein
MNKLFYGTEDNNKGLSQAQQTGIQLVYLVGLTCLCYILSGLAENWNPGVEQLNLLNTCCKKFIHYIVATNYSY